MKMSQNQQKESSTKPVSSAYHDEFREKNEMMPITMIHKLKGNNVQPKVKLGYLDNKNNFEGIADVNTGINHIPEEIQKITDFKEPEILNHNI